MNPIPVEKLADPHFGTTLTITGKLLTYKTSGCWIVPQSAARDESSLRQGYKLLLPGAWRKTLESPLARVTNGSIWGSIEEVEVIGRLDRADTEEWKGEISAVTSLIFRKGYEEQRVDLQRITELTAIDWSSLEYYEDRPEDYAKLLRKLQDDRLI